MTGSLVLSGFVPAFGSLLFFVLVSAAGSLQGNVFVV
jgi:hypothetical protein